MNRLLTCDEMRLPELLDGELPNHLEQDALTHLDHCETCRGRLESLAAQPDWWNETQRLLQASDFPNRPFDERPLIDSNDRPVTALVPNPRPVPAMMDLVRPLLGPSDDPLSIGRLGHYEVRGWIGAGATGVVLQAFDSRLHRSVAIKLLTPALLHCSAARLRFEREGRAMAAVVHPHVVPVYSVDDYRGVPYIVMQWITGGSLQRRIEAQGPLGICEIVRIALQTARGLAAAHEQGLIHRDVKPANILLEPQIERVVVTDFSLARVADETQWTLSGVIAGTPPYMAPEQARGETLDTRSDLFSLGSVLYAMCSGRPPFQCEGVLSTLRQVCEQEPTRLSQLRTDLPRWLVDFTHKLLAKNPQDRFATASEVASLLELELAHLQNPTGVPKPNRSWQTTASVTSHFMTRHGRQATSVAILISILACGIWASFSHDRPTGSHRNPKSTTVLPSTNNQATARTESEDLRDNLSNNWATTEKAELDAIEYELGQLEQQLQTPFRNSSVWNNEVGSVNQALNNMARAAQMTRP